MRNLAGLASIGLLAWLALTVPAFADKRVALVIGNSAYKNANELPNPKNDASDMGLALKRLGFEVLLGVNLDKAELDRKIRDFANALPGAISGLQAAAVWSGGSSPDIRARQGTRPEVAPVV